MKYSWFNNIRPDLTGGLVSATVAIPLAMGYGMFALVPLGDEYFAYGARAELYAAFAAGIVAVLLGNKSTTLYAPRVTTTFFQGFLLYHLVHSDAAVIKSSGIAFTLVVFFAILLLGGAIQALFGLLRLGTLIKFAPHPVMAGFQNVTYSLSDTGFAAISAKTPGTSIKLPANLGRELSRRLRRANRTIRELEG
jgi:SulP family sulfate permease